MAQPTPDAESEFTTMEIALKVEAKAADSSQETEEAPTNNATADETPIKEFTVAQPTSVTSAPGAGEESERGAGCEEEEPEAAPVVKDPKAALAARMARFKALQSQRNDGQKANIKEARDETARQARDPEALKKLQHRQDQAEVKIMKSEDPDFERKRQWDYTAEESGQWDKRVAKKVRNRDNNAFADFRAEANKVYKRQLKNLNSVDLAAYAAEKAEKLQRQVTSGLLELREDPNGDIYTLDKDGRINTPVEENYEFNHKPSKEAIDRLVGDLEKGQQARLKARAARGMRDEDTSGDVTYINQKNKQFNEKLARFYNKYTTEIRESFERGTAI